MQPYSSNLTNRIQVTPQPYTEAALLWTLFNFYLYSPSFQWNLENVACSHCSLFALFGVNTAIERTAKTFVRSTVDLADDNNESL